MSIAPTGKKKGAKGTKRHNLIRSEHNRKRGKYVKQAVRTERNKENRVKRLIARFPKYRAVGRDKQGRLV